MWRLVMLCTGVAFLSAQSRRPQLALIDSPSSAAKRGSSGTIFKNGDTVEVLLSGEWTKARIVGIGRNQYNVELGDGVKHWMRASQLRKVAAPPPAGQPPKPHLTRCARTLEGTFAGVTGFPSIVFHSGEASVQGDRAVECWMGGGKVHLHTPGTRADQDFVMQINSDGSLDTPLGAIRKAAGK